MCQSTLYSFTFSSSSLNNPKMPKGKSNGGGRQKSTRGTIIERTLFGNVAGPSIKKGKGKGKGAGPIPIKVLINVVMGYLSESDRNGSMIDLTPKQREEKTQDLEYRKFDLENNLHSYTLLLETKKGNQSLFPYQKIEIDGEIFNLEKNIDFIKESLEKIREDFVHHEEYCMNADLFEENKQREKEREKEMRARERCITYHRKSEELCQKCTNKNKNHRMIKDKLCKKCNKHR